MKNGKNGLRAKLLATFQVEYKEHLERIRSLLTEMSKGPTPQSAGQLEEAFRRAHSLKGAARAVDLRPIEVLAHHLETLFSRIRDQSLALNHDVMNTITLVLDAIEDWVTAAMSQQTPEDPLRARQAIEKILGMDPSTTEEPMSRAGPSVSPDPSPHGADILRVKSQNIDRLFHSTRQILMEGFRQERVSEDLVGLGRQIAEMEREWDRARKSSSTALRRMSDTPEFSRVAGYLDTMEQQVNHLSAKIRTVQLLHRRGQWSLRHFSEQLQQDVRQARMVPAESVFDGFRKMVRDLSRDEGKEIEFLVTGFEVEADRMVLQTLKDPLMHLLRNAVVHGVEPPGMRKDLGKNPVGRITLKIEAIGNRLTLEVADDGRGLDLKEIARTAARKGILSEAEETTASSRELTELIFKPGFSTTKTVTELSGRGMGLSVVTEAVTRLQGDVAVQPADSHGAVFSLSVPLSISTHRILMVDCQSQRVGIPVPAVSGLHRINVQDLHTMDGTPSILLNGETIPVAPLAGLINLGEVPVLLKDDTIPVVLLKSGSSRIAVAVDSFLGEIDSIIQDLGPQLARVASVNGGIILGDGSVALILNTVELCRRMKESSHEPRSLRFQKPAPEKKARRILVVDDSITTRTLEKSILEASGYEVLLAVDGIEALSQLRTEALDLAVVDIEMPRMDGFSLLGEMKKDSRLAKIPVILVTSRESREDQSRGLGLGADAYIVKRKFDQRNLLDTIRQIL